MFSSMVAHARALWAEQAAFAHALRTEPYNPGDGTAYPITGMRAAAWEFGRVLLILLALGATLPESARGRPGPARPAPSVPALPSAGTALRAALHALRLALLPHLLCTITDLAFSPDKYNMGSRLRNITPPSFAFMLLAECMRVCVAPLLFDGVHLWRRSCRHAEEEEEEEGQWQWDAAPRWIVPRSEAHKWAGAQPLSASPQPSAKGHEPPPGTLHIPSEWYSVPHPPAWSPRRALWALDNFTLRRPGTSWILPGERRAMEWSLRPMLASAAAYRRAGEVEAEGETGGRDAKAKDKERIREKAVRSRRTAPVWFGQTEMSLLPAVAQAVALYAFGWYISALDLRSGNGKSGDASTFDALPLYAQCTLTLGIAALVAFPSALPELLLAPLAARYLPTTATSPFFQRPLAAQGPADMWGRRWHQWYRRDFSSMGRLAVLPLEVGVSVVLGWWRRDRRRSSPQGNLQAKEAATKLSATPTSTSKGRLARQPARILTPGWARALRVLATFSMSAVEHTFVLSPFLPLPPTSPLHIPTLLLTSRTSHILHSFFLLQGLGVVLSPLVPRYISSLQWLPLGLAPGGGTASGGVDPEGSTARAIRTAFYLAWTTASARPLMRHLVDECGMFHSGELDGMMTFVFDWARQGWGIG